MDLMQIPLYSEVIFRTLSIHTLEHYVETYHFHIRLEWRLRFILRRGFHIQQ